MGARSTLKTVLSAVGFDYHQHYQDACNSELFSEQSLREAEIEELEIDLRELSHIPFNWDREEDLEYLLSAMKMAYAQPKILFCIDIEAWEQNQDLITEIGIAIYDPTFQHGNHNRENPYLQRIHIIIEEHEGLRNGKFVLDKKFDFIGEASFIMKKLIAIRLVQTLVHYYFKMVPEMFNIGTVLVGHAVQGDINWLKKLNVTFPQGTSILDTQKIWTATKKRENSSLEKILDTLKFPHISLHNAGNDAYYTLLICLALCNPLVRLEEDLDGFGPDDLDENLGAPESMSWTVPFVPMKMRFNDFEIALGSAFATMNYPGCNMMKVYLLLYDISE